MTTHTCATCHRSIVPTPTGWTDGRDTYPTLCVSAVELTHMPMEVAA